MSSPSSQPQGGGRSLFLAGEGQRSREEPTDGLLPGYQILTRKEGARKQSHAPFHLL